METLIVFASKYGCTEECVKMLSQSLDEKTKLVNLKLTSTVDLTPYDNVIIGGSIYVGKIQKEVREFCDAHLEELQQKKTGLFICGMNEENIKDEINQNFPAELLDTAIVKECFGGAFDFKKMNFIERAIVKKVSNVKENTTQISEERIHKFAEVFR